MTALLGAIPAVPLAGALILALGGARWSRRGIGLLGAGSVTVAAILGLLAGIPLLREPGTVLQQHLGTWIQVGGLDVEFTLRLDSLSLVMVLVVTGVGALIHIYSVAFMRDDEAYGRFFATMNLFVGSMLVLVLAGDLLLLYLGWEGVGLCSYLLIGFWYRRAAAGRAARKAFLVTRVGDTALAVALFLLFHAFGTLRIREIAERAPEAWAAGSPVAVAAAALLLLGAVGKSAQLPLQVWLPDAMEGPTPTSALIHAATMVTAGVYLIARLHVLFSLAPAVQHVVAGIGAATLLLAGCSALVQRDIKRVLAYSTISQIGYMFLALGVGAGTAAMFHLVTHAFFKALLFLVAGCVILAVHEEHDIFRMGGLRRRMPLVFWCAFIGGSALAGLPLVTAGFYSKGRILWDTLASPAGGPGLWLAGLAGVVLTALYTYRWLFVVFLGTGSEDAAPSREALLLVPVVALGVLSLVGGFLELPPYLGNVTLLSDLLRPVLPA
ncbi:MAG: NADH-quinone oxidoreductase subunit L, partial [Acidobacteriota bacterium]